MSDSQTTAMAIAKKTIVFTNKGNKVQWVGVLMWPAKAEPGNQCQMTTAACCSLKGILTKLSHLAEQLDLKISVWGHHINIQMKNQNQPPVIE